MYVLTHCILCTYFLKLLSARALLDDYQKNRIELLEDELTQSLGGRLNLNDEEKIVNKTLMELKVMELEESLYKQVRFNLSQHYFTYRDQIEKSQVYQIIRRMPKGGALHIHSSLMLDADFMLRMTYEDHLYACYWAGNLELQFSSNVPQKPCPINWALLSELRNKSNDVNCFDKSLRNYFTLYSEGENYIHSHSNEVWRRFDKVYHHIKSLISYRPVREKFFYEALKKFYDDNVIYIEIRSGLHSLYELDGTIHDRMYMAKLYQNITNKFIEQYPDFIGVKLILTTHRTGNIDQVRAALDMARKLKAEMPNLFAGFDLVGQEDWGNPLVDYLPALIEAKDEMNFYFHGGETNWFGAPSDENLIDAIILESKRIGHGYSLAKHPILTNMCIENDIALEVNVISNAVLGLVSDVRNHPLAMYIAIGAPVVLSSDDPGIWGADPLSHDFYVAFMAVASKRADLRILKKFAENSIRYSALDDLGKSRFYEVFNKRWNNFLKDVIRNG